MSDLSINMGPLGNDGLKNPVLDFTRRVFGRSKEQETIQQAVEDFYYGRQISLCLTGPPGIGKSFFIKSTLGALEDYSFHYGRYEQFRRSVPFSGVQQVFDSLIAEQLEQSEEELENWKEELNKHFGERYFEIRDIIPTIAEFIHQDESTSSEHNSSPIDLKNRINTTLAEFVEFAVNYGKKPLIVHLDDLQWVDLESLDFLKILMTRRMSSLLLVISYRDDEQSKNEGLEDFIDFISKIVKLETINLEPISKKSTLDWINGLFPNSGSSVEELTDAIYEHGQGNPLLTTEVLSTLVRNGQLSYDWKGQRWDWKIESEFDRRGQESVIALLQGRFERMEPENKNILQASSCFGSNLNIPFIGKITGVEQLQLRSAFSRAVDMGFLKVVDPPEKDSGVDPNNFRFSNDMVQEMIHDTLGDKELKKIHGKQANYYISGSAIGLDERDLYEAVYHLNIAIDDKADEEEIWQHADLNFRATLRAKQAASFSLAMTYLKEALANGLHKEWKSRSEFAAEAHIEGYQIARLTNNNELAMELYSQGVIHCNTYDAVRLRQAKIILDIQFGEYEAALDEGVEALGLLGVKVPNRASRIDLGKEFLKSKWIMRNKRIGYIYNLPEMKDDRLKMVFRIIYWMFRSAQWINPELSGVLAMKELQITLKHGTSGEAYSGLMAYGVIIGAGTNDYKSAFEYCELGNKLAKKYNNYSGAVEFGRAIYRAYRYPLRDTLMNYERARLASQERGNNFGATESTVNESLTYLSAGFPLTEVEEIVRNRADYCGDLSMKDFLEFQVVLLSHVLKLRQLEPGTGLEGRVKEILERTEYRIIVAMHGVLSLQSACQQSDWLRAVEIAKEYEDDVVHLAGLYLQTDYFFYLGMAYACGYPSSSSGLKVRSILRKMRKWADSVPENHGHKVLILEGLMAKSKGQDERAEQALLSAAKDAKSQFFIQNAAIAYRFLADWNEDRNAARAEEYRSEANALFEKWRNG